MITEGLLTIWVNKAKFLIEEINYDVKYKGNFQFNEWNLSEIVFDKVSADDMEKSLHTINKLYTSEQYIPLSENDLKTLSNGIVAPELKGNNAINGKAFSLEQYRGQIVILTFPICQVALC